MNERFNQDRNDSDDAPDMRELDALLRDWHTENMDAAKTGRDRLLAALSANKPAARSKSLTAATAVHNRADDNGHTMLFARLRASGRLHQWRTLAARFSPAAAAILLIAVLIAFNPSRQQRTHADVIYAPEGGALTALDEAGRVKGPCPLKDTYVDVDISGRFARVTLWQTFHNPYHEKIEAVYTFPMGHDGAVDRMTMSIGDRVIVGEVHEREQAKEIYNTAKQQGHVAALLEQERPNIFTQSVANIEPGAEILVEISYVETITPSDGVCEFAFPMTVAPRYIPSSDDRPLGDAGRFATPRDGVNLLAPGRLQAVEKTELVLFNAPSVSIESATPIDIVDATAWESDADGEATTEVASFVVDYEDVPDEQGAIYSNGTGYVGNRWFAFDRNLLQHGTSAVPDAPRITPPAAAPGTRAGHDISIGVTLDTGGPGITDLETPLHATIVRNEAFNADGLPTRSTIDLADVADIPNRDFVLRWRPMTEEITDSVLAHTSDLGNFVTIMIDPPSRVEANDLVPRELVFVIDTSGSMKGQPLDKARQVMANALESMGPNDTFNVIAFSDNATRLWDSPREATTENIDEAHVFVMKHDSNGGTEMMNAVRMALSSEVADRAAIFDDLTKVFNAIHLDELAQSQADGRFVVVRLEPNDLVQLRPESGDDPYMAAIRFADESTLYVRGLRQPVDSLRPGMSLILMGSLHSDADGYDYIELDEFGPTKRPAGTIAPSQLATLPADDRRVSVLVKCEEVDGYTDRRTGEWIEGVRTSNDEFIEFDGFQIHDHDDASAMLLTGRWTGGEDPRFVVEAGIHVPREWAEPSPLRVVCFLTDGEVGNDMSIIDEIRNTAGRTRFFSMGIGNSVNRFLLDGMAEAGRGAGDVITLEDDAHAAVERFVQRMRSPVLLNPSIEFSDGLDIVDMLPAALPDLFDERPIVIHARYVLPGTGTITIRGDAADGPFEKTIDVELPEFEPQNTVLPALWARAKVDSIMNRDLKAAQQNAFPDEWRQEVIDIGETFQIMTQYTSFVAVEQLRVTLGGEPTRIHVPVEP
ncbi:MAG: VWA domain-containing protein, partial [Phycisphaerales bacterium]|nr:VWA domain-containing protein [Phycisphaerales bacterium]